MLVLQARQRAVALALDLHVDAVVVEERLDVVEQRARRRRRAAGTSLANDVAWSETGPGGEEAEERQRGEERQVDGDDGERARQPRALQRARRAG